MLAPARLTLVLETVLSYLAGDEAYFEQRQREKYASAGPATSQKRP